MTTAPDDIRTSAAKIYAIERDLKDAQTIYHDWGKVMKARMELQAVARDLEATAPQETASVEAMAKIKALPTMFRWGDKRPRPQYVDRAEVLKILTATTPTAKERAKA